MPGLTDFVLGWRGFLVGTRRGWHAHHRWGVAGARGAALVVRGSVQADQLRVCAGLLGDVFARGGTAWLFGVGVRANPLWGRVRPAWRPGVLSNYFFARLKRTHFVRNLIKVFQPRRPLRRRTELAVRWLRLRGAGGLARTAPATRAGAFGDVTGRVAGAAQSPRVAPQASPRGARRRGRWFRSWWARSSEFVRPGRPPRHPNGVSARRVTGATARAVRHAQARRVGRRRGKLGGSRVVPGLVFAPARPPARPPGRAVPARTAARHPGWPVSFPTTVVVAGLDMFKSTLLSEVTTAAIPFVRFGGVDFAPRSNLFEVYWNGLSAAGGGLPGLLSDLFVRSHRSGLFRTCWRRLVGVESV